jgi:hypothetical protein
MKILAKALALTMLLGTYAFAGMNADHKIAVHVEDHASRTCTKSFPVIAGCADIVFQLAGPDADCFPVFFDLVGFTGLQHGLDWPGMYTCSYTKCAGDFTIGDIISPGDGVAYTWSTCQYVPVIVVGFGWIYDYGVVCPVPNPTTGLIGTADCNYVEDAPMCIFCAGIGGFIGDDPCVPCDPTAIEASTWGGIKSMFR